MTTLLLDADIIAFKLAATSQKSFAFPGCGPSVTVDEWEDVVPRIHEAIAQLQSQLKTDKVIVCLSCPTVENWRLDVLPTYKGNRKDTVRPVLLQPIKDYMEANWPSYRRDRLEADDIMGILSTHPTLVKGRKVIVSEDKDMKTIPGWLYNPAKDTKPRLICEDEADWWHFNQAIAGDTTDGYSGAPGAGPKAVIKALGDFAGPHKEGQGRKYITRAEGWLRVVEAFALRGCTEEDALVQARVARICRASDYDFKRKEVILWTPPSQCRHEAATA